MDIPTSNQARAQTSPTIPAVLLRDLPRRILIDYQLTYNDYRGVNAECQTEKRNIEIPNHSGVNG